MKPIYIFMLISTMLACKNDKMVYDAAGTFEATEIIVSAEAIGKILLFDVAEGQELEADQIVGIIDTVQLYLRKLQLEASIKAVQNRRPDVEKQIAAIQQQITTARDEKKRIENLLSADVANQKQLDDINAQIAVLEKQLEAQESTLNRTSQSVTEEGSALEIQVAQLDDQLKKCRITNPIKGTVLAKYAEPGEVTAQGKPLYKIADMENIILRSYITAAQLTQVKIGQEVKVFADFGESGYKEYLGIIQWVSNKSEFTPKTIQTRDERANLVYAVKIAVKNDGYLKIGMYGSVELGQ